MCKLNVQPRSLMLIKLAHFYSRVSYSSMVVTGGVILLDVVMQARGEMEYQVRYVVFIVV